MINVPRDVMSLHYGPDGGEGISNLKKTPQESAAPLLHFVSVKWKLIIFICGFFFLL